MLDFPVDLLKNMLYYVARSTSQDPAVLAVKQTADLANNFPGADATGCRGRFARRPDRELFRRSAMPWRRISATSRTNWTFHAQRPQPAGASDRSGASRYSVSAIPSAWSGVVTCAPASSAAARTACGRGVGEAMPDGT